MALTCDFKQTVVDRVNRDPAFAQAPLDEAATLFLRLILRDLVNATIGFEQLATMTDKPSKSLHRMLSPAGNPSMNDLVAIFQVMRACLDVNFKAQSVAAESRLRAATRRPVDRGPAIARRPVAFERPLDDCFRRIRRSAEGLSYLARPLFGRD